MGEREEQMLHIVMYPWLALGHMTSFLHLANKLAERGHKVSFFLPPKARPKLAHLNLHPDHISFITISIPAVHGLPAGAQLTADAPSRAGRFLFEAFDLTQPAIESSLSELRPDFVFYDFAHWLPGLARKHGAKPIFYSTFYISFFAYMSLRGRGLQPGNAMSEADLMRAPAGFPAPPAFRLKGHEARRLAAITPFALGVAKISLWEIMYKGIEESDIVCCRGCREMEGQFGEYFEKQYRKSVLWAGPVLPGPSRSGRLNEKLEGWLKGFEAGSVVYCALGSECVLSIEQLQELVLGLELTGLPFLAVLKSPTDSETIESALPSGFLERVGARGIVDGGWVQQHLILKHSSVGCFVSHCGASSLLEALVTDCQLVLLPQTADQYCNARLIGAGGLRVGVEVEKGEDDGLYTKEMVCDAVKTAIKVYSSLGREIRANHAKWRELFLREGFEESYINQLIRALHCLLG